MEKILTNCLIKMRDDLSQLRHIKECLDSNPDSQYQNGGCSISWRTIEAFNTSLAACQEKEVQELDVLSTILDSFYYISCHNNEDGIWENFGFDLGMICVKFLSLIEQTERFEELFCKLLSTVDIICQHTSDAWKAIGRQILNVFINKKLSIASLETGLQLYVCILRKIDISILANFALQNFHLIKTFFKTARRAGDIEIQSFIVEAAFLHVHSNIKLLEDFILELESEVKQSFHNLNLVNFKDKCRIYLNILNNSENDKKVYSLSCKKIVLGDCTLEPPFGKNLFWLDANDSTKRISIRCLDFKKKSSHDFFILIQFSSVIHIQIEQQSENVFKIIFNLEKLNNIFSFAKTNRMVCTITAKQSSHKDIVAFKNFVEKHVDRTNSENEKLSQNSDSVSNVKNVFYNGVVNENDDKKKFGINRIVPNALTLLQKIKNEKALHQTESEKMSKYNESNTGNDQNKSPECGFEKEKLEKPLSSPKCNNQLNTMQEPEELSPNSFLESLNKNLGLDSPTISSSYEGSLIPVSFELNSLDQNSHSLFQESNIIFEFSNRKSQQVEFNSLQDMSKKGNFEEKNNFSNFTKSNPSCQIKHPTNTPSKKYLELSDTQSDKYFYSQINKKRKPRMPKLKNIIGKNNKKKSGVIEDQNKQHSKTKSNLQAEYKLSEKPSLLDPNGYAYKRWLKPTTSARSKFWLDKIKQLEEKKRKLTEIFEFTDESDVEWKSTSKKIKFPKQMNRGRKKKQRNLKNEPEKKSKNSKQKGQNAKKMQQKQKHNGPKRKMKIVKSSIRENLKLKPEQKSILKEKNYTKKGNAAENITSVTNQQFSVHSSKEMSENYIEDSLKSCQEKFPQINQMTANEQVIDFESTDLMLHSNENLIIAKSSSFESLSNWREKSKKKFFTDSKKQEKTKNTLVNECNERSDWTNDDIELSEVEDDSFDFQKRKFLHEETFASNDLISNKKLKSTSNKSLTPFLRSRIEKFQTKIKKETDEIIDTFATATFRLVNYIHKKNVHSLISYMKKAEKTSFDLDSCSFEDKIEKIEKVYVYYKNKCSGLEIYHSILAHLSSAKNAIECWSETKNMVWSKIKNFNNELENLISNEIDEMIKRETESFKHKITQYTLFFNEDSG